MRAELAQYGGITVMIPAAIIIAVWLRYSNPWALRAWVITFGVMFSLVGFLLFVFYVLCFSLL